MAIHVGKYFVVIFWGRVIIYWVMELDKYFAQQGTWSHSHDKEAETAVLTFLWPREG